MSQLLDSSSAGNPPPPTKPPTHPSNHPPATCQLPYHCSDVRRGCTPWERHGNPASFSLFAACHLNTDAPYPPPRRSITSCFSSSLFPLYFSRWADTCLPAARSRRIVSPQRLSPQFEVSLPVCSGWSHMQHHPHFETTPWDAHQSCRKKRCSITSLKLKSSLRQSRNRLSSFFFFFLVQENGERMSSFKRDDRNPVCQNKRSL